MHRFVIRQRSQGLLGALLTGVMLVCAWGIFNHFTVGALSTGVISQITPDNVSVEATVKPTQLIAPTFSNKIGGSIQLAPGVSQYVVLYNASNGSCSSVETNVKFYNSTGKGFCLGATKSGVYDVTIQIKSGDSIVGTAIIKLTAEPYQCNVSTETELLAAVVNEGCDDILITNSKMSVDSTAPDRGILLTQDFDGNGKTIYVDSGNYGFQFDTSINSVDMKKPSPEQIIISNATIIGKPDSKALFNLNGQYQQGANATAVTLNDLALDASNSWYALGVQNTSKIIFDNVSVTAAGKAIISYDRAPSNDLSVDFSGLTTLDALHAFALDNNIAGTLTLDCVTTPDTIKNLSSVYRGEVMSFDNFTAQEKVNYTFCPITDTTPPTLKLQSNTTKPPTDLSGATFNPSFYKNTNGTNDVRVIYTDETAITNGAALYMKKPGAVNYTLMPTKNNGGISYALTIDGEYSIYAQDAAGNQSTPITFVIDTKSPTGNVLYSPTSWTNKNVVATLTTSEPSLTPAGWDKNDDSHFTKTFTENSSEVASVCDLAGNCADVTVLVDWIDKTKPNINVTEADLIVDHDRNVLSVGVVDKFADSGSGLKEISCAIYADATKNSPIKKLNNCDDDIDISYLDDGTYYLHLWAKDKAGNQVGDRPNPFAVKFTINRQADSDEKETQDNNVTNESNNNSAAQDSSQNTPESTAPAQSVATRVASAIGASISEVGDTTENSDTSNDDDTTADIISNTDAATNNNTTPSADDAKVLGAQDTQHWALLNLLLAATTALISIVMLIAWLGKDERDDNRHGLLRTLTLLPALGAVISFFMTENWSLPMKFVDTWTWLMVAIFIIQIIIIFLATRHNQTPVKKSL